MDFEEFSAWIDLATIQKWGQSVANQDSEEEESKKLTIEELFGIAVGQIGMSVSDFEMCTPSEFESAVKMWHEKEEARLQSRWKMVRTMTTIMIQPHIKKKITPTSLLPFPWDKPKEKASPISRDEQRRRFYDLMK